MIGPSSEGSPGSEAEVLAFGESVDLRLAALAHRLDAVEQELREHAALLDRPVVGDPRTAVDEGLRALTTGQPERGPSDAP